MKVRETREVRDGFAQLARTEVRVRKLAEGEAVPAGAEEVGPNTTEHGWQPVEPATPAESEE